MLKIKSFTSSLPLDCPADQTARYSKMPGPTCDNPNPAEDQTESFRCFCPDGMFIKADGSCVLPNGCIGEVQAIDCSSASTIVH